MAYPKILQRLFEHSGAGPRLRKEILPFGSTPGTACEGNDARLSNARVPEMHKKTHQMGGADALTPEDIGAHPADGMASAGKEGIARLSSAVDLDSEDRAATPRAVKAVYSEAVKSASLTQAGRVKLNNTVSSTSAAEAATANAVKTAYDKASEAASTPATPDRLGMVRIGQGIGVDENGVIFINPWAFSPCVYPSQWTGCSSVVQTVAVRLCPERRTPAKTGLCVMAEPMATAVLCQICVAA